MTDAPKRIYLQLCDDEDCTQGFSEHEGVTWCQDKINDTDVEYVRADVAAHQAQAAPIGSASRLAAKGSEGRREQRG